MSDLNPDCENGTVTGGAGGAGERPLKHGAEYHPEPVCEPIALSSSVKHGVHRSSILPMSPVHAMILFTLVTLTLNLLTASSCGFGPPAPTRFLHLYKVLLSMALGSTVCYQTPTQGPQHRR